LRFHAAAFTFKKVIGIFGRMNNQKLEAMSADDLWNLHEKICALLLRKLDAEKQEFERRLAQLKTRDGHRDGHNERSRRPYPKLHPKYRNPEQPFQTWAGRDERPRWVAAQLLGHIKVPGFASQKKSRLEGGSSNSECAID
jgi:DNA-binding protein H-NS